MRVNLFEGGRRIAVLLSILAAIAAVGLTALDRPRVSIAYSIATPGGPLQRLEGEECSRPSEPMYFTHYQPDGTLVSVSLCLLASAFGETNEMLIPYKRDGNGVWGAASYSDEVSQYERELERAFSLPPKDASWVGEERNRLLRQQWFQTLGGLAVGLAIFWVVVWTLGWIVRGFAGIPRGMDRRPD